MRIKNKNAINNAIIDNIASNLDNLVDIINTYDHTWKKLFDSMLYKYRLNREIMTQIFDLVSIKSRVHTDDELLKHFTKYDYILDETSLETACKTTNVNFFDILIDKYNIVPNYTCLINTISMLFDNYVATATYQKIYKNIIKIFNYKVEPNKSTFTYLMSKKIDSPYSVLYLEQLIELFILFGLTLDQNMIKIILKKKIRVNDLDRFTNKIKIDLDKQYRDNISRIYNLVVGDKKMILKRTIDCYDSTESIIYAQYFKKDKSISFTKLRQELLEFIHNNKYYKEDKIILPKDLKKLLKISYIKSINTKYLDNVVSLFY